MPVEPTPQSSLADVLAALQPLDEGFPLVEDLPLKPVDVFELDQ